MSRRKTVIIKYNTTHSFLATEKKKVKMRDVETLGKVFGITL